jgi:Spy/CpxP family protein refolding chaperone
MLLADLQADEGGKKGKKGKGGDRQGFQFRQPSGPLVPTELADKLKLTDDQKGQVAKLQKEFEEKTKTAADKLKELGEKATKDKNREAFQELREQAQAIRKTRTEFEDKVKGLLKDDQKKTFEDEIKTRAEARRPGGPGGFPGRGAPQSTSIFSRDVQEKLNLTAEQKAKLEKIKKALDDLSTDVLTAEQKKKLEELKSAPRGGAQPERRPGGNRPGGNRPPK